ncbi:uncharacterized protein JCM10292_007472 [Rhodotorula paludigena]|uniref:uncharacterized protein n=1 Tax=Rhodotorula paludigena TaxID=86838 RepID=UPI0031762EE7
MRSTIEGFEINSSIATRLIRLSWANAQEWRAIRDDQVKIAVSPLVYAQHNTSVVMEYAKLGLERVQGCDRSLQSMQEVSSCLKRLFAAWTLEVDSPLSLHLRKAAHERGDRTAWQQLQWREIAYRQGVDGCKAARVQLAKMVARFLDSVRSRSGISSYDYVAYFERLQELQPDELKLQPRKELLPRS